MHVVISLVLKIKLYILNFVGPLFPTMFILANKTLV